ncbi:MAG: hypothetical protein A3A24_00755 [Candidatus Buchananbacteria bacterium RIFCSPLOWO2_01_FULL_46_12]|uniref:Uncharacterized protein n=1 Tax=Candidatus Buchananbacteria bacterium RIFCSPLOWO2_01_FULL_46_12 TaxID=1797546 RepID=A0A1G1YRT8_9BACT|nr:MAG: hypothetical protein A3A24_00755 [Candidatus Buchananbacteria bacterium RIFCSPLOWO2_01_FULL_46_12]
MAEAALLSVPAAQIQEPMVVQGSRAQPLDTDFDLTRTFSVLLATLVIPVYLGLSVVSYSLAAIY